MVEGAWVDGHFLVDALITRTWAIVLAVVVCVSVGAGAQEAAKGTRYNVLFIAVDDLKPLLGCYGESLVRSPNIDALARRGVAFTRAYCQQAVCSPSRASVMTGRRPDSTKVYDLVTHFRKALPQVVTLPQRFKEEGYFAASVGKIYHPGVDDAPSWSVPNDYKVGGKFFDPNLVHETRKAGAKPAPAEEGEEGGDSDEPGGGKGEPFARGPSFTIADVADDELPDGKIAKYAIEMLRASKDKRFFIAAGFLRPHLPFVAPRRYYEIYPPDSIKLAENPRPPMDAPTPAMHNSAELRSYKDIPKKQEPIPEETARELIRGYYASATFVDAQVGRVLEELDRLGLRESTIVVLWGDHGWHLGDHGLWTKHTNFEEATRSPLIVSVPGMKSAAGARCDALVELVDIYPTLCELAGVAKPAELEGASFARLLERPDQGFKSAALSQFPRGKTLMGYSMRTERYRYTEWREKGTGKVTARELYDHEQDPREDENVAAREGNKQLVERLHAQMEAGWRGAGPAK
jgi:arylsulfatase A-like enzyme